MEWLIGVHGNQVTPMINPGASFRVRYTPPRAGTFMYHTHLHDQAQLSGGLYGPLIVVKAERNLTQNMIMLWCSAAAVPGHRMDQCSSTAGLSPPPYSGKAASGTAYGSSISPPPMELESLSEPRRSNCSGERSREMA